MGWNEKDKLVVLNPAGFFKTRNWTDQQLCSVFKIVVKPVSGYEIPGSGTTFIDEKADFLQQELGDSFINLVGNTSPSEAFAMLQHATLVLSEDSGLMHMAWVSGIPTITLFGSTRSDWSRPLGAHSFFLDSSDLPCGNCMEADCRMGDMRCLARITPETILEQALILINH